MTYLWTKTLHLLFVMAWMAAVFYLPRILVNLAEAGAQPDVRARLLLMGRRLYRFGHVMFGLSLLMGLALWQGWRLWPQALPPVALGGGWLHAKLVGVALLLGLMIWSGARLRRIAAGAPAGSATRLRLLNELPVLVLLGVLWLAVAKPF